MLLEARLRAFAAFARRRSFTAAAAELHISQPAVSKHLADLERALGLRLIERARRDGALTSAGEFVANHVLRAEALLVQATLGAAELRMSGSGSLGIAPSLVTGAYLLSALKRGYGVAAISRYIVAAEVQAGSLTVIPVRGWNVRAVISMLRVRDAMLTPSADQFQVLVRKRFGEISRERLRMQR